MKVAYLHRVLLIAITTLVCPWAMANDRVALVVGNAHYQHVPALGNTGNDANDVTTKLKGLGFDVIKVIDGTAREQRSAIATFKKRLRSADVGLFYYSGHGIAVNGANYIIPVDAKLASNDALDRELVRVDSVIDGSASSGKKLLLFLDACRDNPFLQKVAMLSGVSASRGLAVTKRMQELKADVGLSRLEAGNQNLFVAFATQPGNVALDGLPGSRNSPFTAAFIQHVDQKFEVRELLTRVRASVANGTDFKQIPWEQNSLLEPIYLAGKPNLTKIDKLDVGVVESVNTDWQYLVVQTNGPPKAKVGDTILIQVGSRMVKARVQKVLASQLSVLPEQWDDSIQVGMKVTREVRLN